MQDVTILSRDNLAKCDNIQLNYQNYQILRRNFLIVYPISVKAPLSSFKKDYKNLAAKT